MNTYKDKDIVSLEGDELRRYQLNILEIAKDFVKVCEKYNLSYSLNGGSVIGAVRHGGFIPWDDDIDFNITRESYDKLLNIFDKELGDKYYIQTPMNHPEMGLMITQIRQKGTVARRKYDWNIPKEDCGISIDLYIIENVFNNPIARYVQVLMSMFCAFATSSIRACNNKNLPHRLIELENREINYGKSKMIFGKIFNLIPLNKWIKWCDYWNSLCKDNASTLIAIPTAPKHFGGEIFSRSAMCNFMKADFESESFNIPIGYDEYLKKLYGDYMTIPPKDKREEHLFLELDF